MAHGDERTAAARGIPYHETVSRALFLSFFLGFSITNLITGLSGWCAPDYSRMTQETVQVLFCFSFIASGCKEPLGGN